MSFFAQPSLARRSFIVTASAFFVVWAALLTYIYTDIKVNETNQPILAKFGGALAKSLEPVAASDQAIAVITSTEVWVNLRRNETGMRSGAFKFMLIDRDQKLLYHSSTLTPHIEALTKTNPSLINIQGVRHLVYYGKSADRALIIAEPIRTDVEILMFNGKALLPYLLVALPFVLLPVWLSVRFGLRPLKEFSKNIEARNADELSPVTYPVVHQELRPLVHALDSLFLRLKKKVSTERAFVQDAAHELRTPMAVIATQAHVLAHTASTEDRMVAQSQLEDAISRASHLSSQLLCLASLDEPSPNTLTTRNTLDIAHWLRSAMAAVDQTSVDRCVELSLDAPDVLMIEVDQSCLESVFSNLLDNAIRYAPTGGNVAVTLHDGQETISLSIQDDGKGIPDGEKPLIFERFFRGSGHDDISGSGLGLAIVKQACLRMNATITLIQGLEGRGVGFNVQVPKT